MYLRWRRQLPAWIELVPVELPGRGARMDDPPVSDFDAQVARLCDEQAAAMCGPYALFGHSMGALLAYGMALHRRLAGLALPRALFVSGTSAPSCRDPARFEGLDTDQALCDDLRRQGGTPEALFRSPELLALTLRVLKADYRVCGSFSHHAAEAPLPVPLHAFGGRDDDLAPGALAAWREHTSAGFTLREFEGGHFFLREHEAALLALVIEGLAAEARPWPLVADAAA